MAAATEKTAPAKKHGAFIDRFREAYEATLATARLSAEHTATEGWQTLYSDYRKSVQARRKQLAKDMRSIADTLEKYGLDDEDEKRIGEIKKQCAELREEQAVFTAKTVNPVRDPVNECDKLIETTRYDANRAESESPLTHRGIVEIFKAELGRLSRATWDDETGRVLIS